MPQATNELRARMLEQFGDAVDDRGPRVYLKERGYTAKRFLIRKPSSLHVITREERECINFLCDEWDWAYDPIPEPPPTP